VLVRGGDLDGIYGVYGISVFAVRSTTVDELAQQVQLVRFDRLSLLRVGDVAAGMRPEPTGRKSASLFIGWCGHSCYSRRPHLRHHRNSSSQHHDSAVITLPQHFGAYGISVFAVRGNLRA
jgi:hypothetical protein